MQQALGKGSMDGVRMTDVSKPFPDKRIVWIASYGKLKATIYLGGPLPGWIHEHAQQVRWKLIKGAELL